ncbi:hypothetical protein N7481_007258 [Penicillium waksmanii]|uniref:uncharacterized protein n=1 Tax=Penicillium waksmanii TaxID=69791 RepID=UPI0025467AA6|nr:uncharacterized protein N7481_007258 [Penicillium waksmanii]KAJ5979960.1 hypothetical protein N7481_007258 [Penicillium waksmanii]
MHLQTEPRTPSNPTPTSASTSTQTATTTSNQPPKQKHLYFAYGSNLSPTQMSTRCRKNPTSSTPLAIAFLPHWRWLICQAGYANVLPPPDLRTGKQNSQAADKVPISSPGLNGVDGVYGILYELDPADERVLDRFEGVDYDAPRGWKGGRGEEVVDISPRIRPREQGLGSYNKWFLGARVVKWLSGSESEGDVLRVQHQVRDDTDVDAGDNTEEEVDILVYVDENRIVVGPPKLEYIGRMNRAIKECAELGVDEGWIGGGYEEVYS